MKPQIGSVFEDLTLIGFEGDKPLMSGKSLFRCVCGNEKKIKLYHVVSGATVSCGCAKRKHNLEAGYVSDRLTVLDAERVIEAGVSKVKCRCSCGNEKLIPVVSLAKGQIKSCGCLVKEQIKTLSLKHGGEGTPLYGVWASIKARCLYPNAANYENYGGRGIAICQEWLDDFVVFKDWATNSGYSKGLQIDRIDVNGNYCPENCRWVTPKVNANNRRNNVRLELFGESKTVAEWSRDERCEVSGAALKQRVRKGRTPLNEILKKH